MNTSQNSGFSTYRNTWLKRDNIVAIDCSYQGVLIATVYCCTCYSFSCPLWRIFFIKQIHVNHLNSENKYQTMIIRVTNLNTNTTLTTNTICPSPPRSNQASTLAQPESFATRNEENPSHQSAQPGSCHLWVTILLVSVLCHQVGNDPTACNTSTYVFKAHQGNLLSPNQLGLRDRRCLVNRTV